MRAGRIRKTRKNEKGQSLVEFALVVPLLLLLVVGIFEFGRAWMTKNIVTGAAREAVRIYAVDQAGGANLARTRANEVLNAGMIFVPPQNIEFTPAGFNQPVSVKITTNFQILTGLIPGLDNLEISSTTTMRREY